MRRPQWIIADSLVALAILLSVPSAFHRSALAQTNPAAEVATYQGADRGQRLLEGAKKEKELTFYSSIPTEDITALVAAFDKKYGVKVKVWRADSEGFLQRIISEVKPGASRSMSWPARPPRSSRLSREFAPGGEIADFADLIRGDCPAPAMGGGLSQHHRPGLQTRISYRRRTSRSPIETCSSLNGRARSVSSRRISTGSHRSLWISARHAECNCSDIVAANGVSVRKGHNLLANLVAAGEVPLALTVYGFLAEQAKRKGAPLDWFVIPPAVARMTAEGLARNAPHPNAAMLFFDFLIGEGQQLLASRQFVTVTRTLETPINRGALKLIDSAAMLDQARKWQDLYQRTIIGASR